MNHLNDFKAFLLERGYKAHPVTNMYEVLRMKNGKNTVVIYRRNSAEEHLSVPDKNLPLVRMFFSERRAKGAR